MSAVIASALPGISVSVVFMIGAGFGGPDVRGTNCLLGRSGRAIADCHAISAGRQTTIGAEQRIPSLVDLTRAVGELCHWRRGRQVHGP